MADLQQRAAGDAGHVADHNAIATWLNAQGFDEGHSILPPSHTGFPGDATQFLRGDGIWAIPPGGGGSSTVPTNTYVIYVSPGSSIQTAVNALPAQGGAIVLMPGLHDLGSGFISLDKTKSVAFVGYPMTRWRRYAVDFSGSSSVPGPLIRTTNQYVFKITSTAFTDLQGMSFKWLNFDHRYVGGGTFASTGVSILADNVNHGLVEDCYFFMGSATTVAIAAFSQDSFLQSGTAHGDDASWWRVKNNFVRDGRLFIGATHWGGTGTGGNQNNHVIESNHCIGGTIGGSSSEGIGPNPAVWIRGGHRCQVLNNNFEPGWDPAIVMEGGWDCMLYGNGGENGSATTGTFIELRNQNGTTCDDIGVSTPSGALLYKITGSSHDNMTRSASLQPSGLAYGNYPAGYSDTSTGPNWFQFPGHVKLGTQH